ncbi:hypothetical protein VNO77_43326 [Canavalia gladiata]|uniref:Transmembrane protein n=1 Tax=Canavalia gladiata TaxID=3824 RepID=A0AAN9PMT6_CANGL
MLSAHHQVTHAPSCQEERLSNSGGKQQYHRNLEMASSKLVYVCLMFAFVMACFARDIPADAYFEHYPQSDEYAERVKSSFSKVNSEKLFAYVDYAPVHTHPCPPDHPCNPPSKE